MYKTNYVKNHIINYMDEGDILSDKIKNIDFLTKLN